MSNAALKIDLHIHTNVSDGTDSPEELLHIVKKEGIDVFSVTDHDAVKAALIINNIRRDGDPLFIPGAEFSCKDENGKFHILGYGYDPSHSSIERLIKHGHDLRMKKVTARLDFLKSELGIDFPEEEIVRLLSLDNPGKPHIANLMVKFGYADSKEQAIKEKIDLIHFRNEYVRPEEAITSIIEGGGIPVLAHPFYGSGDELILGDEMEERIKYLMGFGLRGIEAFYSGFTSKLRDGALKLAEKFDLLVTAGSDYHGTNKMVSLGDTGLDGLSELPERLTMFLKAIKI